MLGECTFMHISVEINACWFPFCQVFAHQSSHAIIRDHKGIMMDEIRNTDRNRKQDDDKEYHRVPISSPFGLQSMELPADQEANASNDQQGHERDKIGNA